MTRSTAGPLAREAALLAAALRDLLAEPAAHAGAGGAGGAGGADHNHDGAAAGFGTGPFFGRTAGCDGSQAHTGFPAGQQDDRSGGAQIVACQACPVCRLVATVAAGRPEVAVHLFAAVTSLAAALRATLAAPVSDVPGSAGSHAGTDRQESTTERPRPRSRVQRIDVE
ncbi:MULTISPECIES: hypothetical protein [unclassified Frankia]|uniref:hypothetical protein n=1 Tax=unclassified Frankia TaxID=2632575 RepID=UPI001EF46B1A|nr:MULTISPECIES: hypothetical protein [unclassified Frankia]